MIAINSGTDDAASTVTNTSNLVFGIMGIGTFLLFFFFVVVVLIWIFSTPCGTKNKVLSRMLSIIVFAIVFLVLIFADHASPYAPSDNEIKVYDESAIPRILLVIIMSFFSVVALGNLIAHTGESKRKGRELLMDLKRSDFLPSYDDEGVRLLLSEMNDLHDKFAEIVSSTTDADVDPYSPAVKAALSYYHECLCRNRRYINSHFYCTTLDNYSTWRRSYLTYRIAKIRGLPWETGAVLPERIKNDTLSARENDYFNAYSNCLSEYSNDVGCDLISDMEPPKELLIQIRVLVPCGEIMTEYGPVNLSLKGSEQFVRRTDVEHLIRHGHLEHVQWDGGKL